MASGFLEVPLFAWFWGLWLCVFLRSSSLQTLSLPVCEKHISLKQDYGLHLMKPVSRIVSFGTIFRRRPNQIKKLKDSNFKWKHGKLQCKSSRCKSSSKSSTVPWLSSDCPVIQSFRSVSLLELSLTSPSALELDVSDSGAQCPVLQCRLVLVSPASHGAVSCIWMTWDSEISKELLGGMDDVGLWTGLLVKPMRIV